MNLCDRLYKNPGLGYGKKYCYRMKGLYFLGKSNLINDVVERYSKINKICLTAKRSNELYERLSLKYCTGIGYLSCLNSLKANESESGYWHPKEERKKVFQLRMVRMEVDSATSQPDGPYCELKYPSSTWHGLTTVLDTKCRICGGRMWYTHVDKHGEKRKCFRYIHQLNNYKLHRICRNAFCKAIAAEFGAVIKKSSELPMAAVLMELTKNGDRSESIRKFKEFASRDIYKTHNRRTTKKGCTPICTTGSPV